MICKITVCSSLKVQGTWIGRTSQHCIVRGKKRFLMLSCAYLYLKIGSRNIRKDRSILVTAVLSDIGVLEIVYVQQENTRPTFECQASSGCQGLLFSFSSVLNIFPLCPSMPCFVGIWSFMESSPYCESL